MYVSKVVVYLDIGDSHKHLLAITMDMLAPHVQFGWWITHSALAFYLNTIANCYVCKGCERDNTADDICLY